MSNYVVRECTDSDCRFRFPAGDQEGSGDRCPRCRGRTRVVMLLPSHTPEHAPRPHPRVPLCGLLDNVRSLFNAGSIFRSADGAGFAHLYLCGITPTPANPKLAKTALGAEVVVPWSHHNNAVELANQLLASGVTLWALEESPTAASIFAVQPTPGTFVLVAGNEVTGVDPELLACCAQTVAIPMRGSKRSLNVATAFGIAAAVIANLCYSAAVDQQK